MPCSYSVTSEDTADFISTYSALPEQLSAMTGIECIDFVSRQFAVLHIPMDDLERPMNFSYYTYSAIPKLYSLLATDSMEASGILPASRIPAFGNQGQGVLIGFVDTGIDYQNPLFRKTDGSSRILGIWDQTLETGAPDPVNGFQALYGTQYSREEIDQALAAPDPLALVPSADENGHGTFLASVAAGGEDPDQDFTGAAPKASIAMVKLKPAKAYLRDFYLIREGADAYQENDIMMGVAYLLHLARRFSMPLVICLGLGTNQGSHVGKSPLGLYLDDINIYAGTAVITAAGNETGYGHHYRAVTRPEETLQTVELNVGEKDSGFSMEFWAQDVDIYRVGFISPTGEVVDPLPSSTEEENVIRFLVEQTEITVFSSIVNTATGSQMVFIRFKDPMPGIWNLTVQRFKHHRSLPYLAPQPRLHLRHHIFPPAGSRYPGHWSREFPVRPHGLCLRPYHRGNLHPFQQRVQPVRPDKAGAGGPGRQYHRSRPPFRLRTKIRHLRRCRPRRRSRRHPAPLGDPGAERSFYEHLRHQDLSDPGSQKKSSAHLPKP